MSINTMESVANAQTNLRNVTTASKSDKLGKNDFMNLFLTQMSHQDPTNPMDNGAMMTQMSQMGSLEQLENINAEIKTLNKHQQEIAKFQALNAIDKDVMMDVSKVELSKGTGKPVFYNLENDVNGLKVVIEAKDGSPVFSDDLGLVQTGRHQFSWDGKNNEGVLMGDGQYNIRFLASNPDGSVKEIQAYHKARVNNIEYKDGKAWVQANGMNIPYENVKAIDTSSYKQFGTAQPLPMINDFVPKTLGKPIKG